MHIASLLILFTVSLFMICGQLSCAATAKIGSAANLDIDPCENMYEYGCGKWLEETTIPSHMTSYSSFHVLNERLARQLSDMLEKNINITDSHYVQIVKLYYKACSRNVTGAKYLVRDLDAIGSWPMANKHAIVSETKDISDFQINMTKVFGLQELVNFDVATDFKNASRQSLQISETYTTLNRKKYLNDSEYGKYQTHLKILITKTARMIARDSNCEVPPDLDIQVEQLFEFEKDLAKITATQQERMRLKLRHNPHSLANAEKLMDGLRVRDMMKASFRSRSVDAFLTDDLEVNVQNVTFIRSYMELLQKTSKRTIVNFIIWKNIKDIIGNLGVSYQKMEQDYKRETTGQVKREDRWRYCAQTVNDELPEAVSALYIKEYIDPSIKTSLLLTKTQSFYHMARAVAQWHAAADGEKLLKPTNRMRWPAMQPARINAGYYDEGHAMVFPAAILQPPFYFPGGPDSLNYGAIGGIIGHEVTHGFDNRGMNFDFEGELNNWWSNESGQAFEARTKCFVKQYSSYMIPELNKMLDGGLTLDENIGDNGGVRMAYDALKSKFGNDFAGSNEEKAFFRSWARTWCSKKLIEELEIDRLSDPHSAPLFRVNGVLSNMPEFQSAYNCSPMAKMVRPDDEKCRIW